MIFVMTFSLDPVRKLTHMQMLMLELRQELKIRRDPVLFDDRAVCVCVCWGVCVMPAADNRSLLLAHSSPISQED